MLVTALCLPVAAQRPCPSLRPVDRIQVKGASRLTALAKLGSLIGTTILVEAAALPYLQSPVTITVFRSTVGEVARKILGDSYTWRQKDALFIVEPVQGARNRLLDLRLATFDTTGTSISSLYPYLEYRLALATGCKPGGFGWAGPPGEIGLVPIHIADATLENVLARTAEARDATMGILPAEPSQYGCVRSAFVAAEVGVYGFGHNFALCLQPFSTSVGPDLLGKPLEKAAFPACNESAAHHP